MDKLFKALPRDLQWEILSEFVGTHVVRNGKLMRKMSGNIQRELADKMRNDCDRLYLKFQPSFKPAGEWFTYKTIRFNNKFLLFRRDDMAVYLCLIASGDMFYMYSTLSGCFIVPMDDSVILTPFVKNEYPSYPFTNKKMGIANKNMTLYNPIPVAYTLSEEEEEYCYYRGKFYH
jgi:hypothetical protein